MVRTQISLDEETYREIKRRAYESNRSMASVIREMLREAMAKEGGRRKRAMKLSDFGFVGAAVEDGPDNVSERHDEVLGEGEW